MMMTESSSLVGRRSPAPVAGFSFVAKVRFWPKAVLTLIQFLVI